MNIPLGRLALSTLFLLLCAAALAAQDLDDVTISGKVIDSAGLAVAGAKIVAAETETGLVRTTTSDDKGSFRFVKLKPGTYKIKIENRGFATQEQADLHLVSGQVVLLDFKLSPAGVKAEQTINLTDENTPAVDTTKTVVGGTITERQIEETPNDSRSPLDLVLTLGGTAEEQLSTRDLAEDRGRRGLTAPGTTPEEAGIFGLSGGAAYSNNITIDGLDNNDDRSASFRFEPSIDAISEVQVITNQFSAEYGRASGGRVNLRTRAGGNRFRGRVFYFFRDDNLNANTWNNNRRNIARPRFTDNDPGFTFGGPIIKNKLFFFAAYEYDNIKEDTLLDAWVPVVNSNSHFSVPSPTDLSKTVTVSSGADSVQVAPYIAPFDTPAIRHIFTARADWNINKAQNITFSYQMGRSNDLRQFSGTNRIGDSLIGRIRNSDAYNLTHNYVITSNAVNQFRLQYSTLRPRSEQNSGALDPAVLVTFTPPGGSSTTQVFGSTSSSSDRIEDRWQLQDTFSYVRGRHTFRVGVDYQNVDTTFVDRFDATGTYRFSNFVSFDSNLVSSMTQNFNTTSEIKNAYYGLFGQGETKVRPNITLSYGLRYEKEKVVDDSDNFGPRLAVAWNPFPKGQKTVVRLGAGLFYNRVLLRTIDDFTSGSQELSFNSASPNAPLFDQNVIRPALSSIFPNALTLDTVIPVTATSSFTVRQLSRSPGAFRSISPDLKVPESYQFNAGFEREIFKGLVFETNVTYNRTTHLWREFNPNAPVLPSDVPDRNSDGQITLTDFLLGITTGPNRFESLSAPDTVGSHPLGGTGACTTSTPICVVNVNTTNSNSSTTCSTSVVTNTPVCRAFSVLDGLRPHFSQVGSVQQEQVASIGNSSYVGAIFELRNRYRKFGYGFAGSMRIAYTLSRLKDDGIVNTSEATLPGDFDREWSRSLADRTHRLAVTATIDTSKWLGRLRFSPLFRYGSGAPFNIGAGGIDRNLDDISNDRPNFNGNLSDINWRKFDSGFPQALADRFAVAPIGSPGNLPRNAGRGPSLYQFNLNVSRDFKIGERFKLHPSAEFTNVFNTTVFSFGSNFIDFDLLNSTNATTVANAKAGFLAPTRTGTARRLRFGVRFDF